MSQHSPICCIVPEDILCRLADQPQHRARALRTLILTERLRGRRVVLQRIIRTLPARDRSSAQFMMRSMGPTCREASAERRSSVLRRMLPSMRLMIFAARLTISI